MPSLKLNFRITLPLSTQINKWREKSSTISKVAGEKKKLAGKTGVITTEFCRSLFNIVSPKARKLCLRVFNSAEFTFKLMIKGVIVAFGEKEGFRAYLAFPHEDS